MITEIEEYFAKGCGRCARFATPECSTRRWSEGLAALRDLCLDAGLSEVVKWGHPTYMHAGRNVAMIGAFRGDFRLTFFRAALMSDPKRLLDRRGPNSAHPDMIRFRDSGDVAGRAGVISEYLAEARGYAEAGVLPVKAETEIDLPDELVSALDADPALAEAFQALTPGRQKSYAIAIGNAKRPETRIRRIEGYLGRIFAGKGALER